MLNARIVGPEEELGDVHKGLTFFGHHLTRDWSTIDPSPEALKRLKANRYVELDGHAAVQAVSPAAPAKTTEKAPETEAKSATADEASVRAALDELGVSYKEDAKLGTLRMMLGKARKAQAEA